MTKITICAVLQQWDFHRNFRLYIYWNNICNQKSIKLKNTIYTRNIEQSYAVRFTVYKVNLILCIVKLFKKVLHQATQIFETM